MPRIIPDDGSLSARIVLIGEMPAAFEEAQGRPFVGPSGQKLTAWWRALGMQRSDLYITNVMPYRANKQNKIEMVPWSELQPNIELLHERLAELADPWLIVPTGNTALRALTGKSGITKHRGSIYAYKDRRNRLIKVIPTIHPAALFRIPYWEKRCVMDWRRIQSDAEFRDLRVPVREHFIKPTISDLWDYYEDAKQRAEMLAFDIETPRKTTYVPQGMTKAGKPKKPKRMLGEARITLVGFAFESHFSISVDTTMEYWQDEAQLKEVWQVIRLLLALPCAKGGQNAYAFDNPWLLEPEYNAPVRNFMWDSLGMHHCREGRDDHAMQYQQSLYTREPYHKDEAKDPDEVNKWTADLDAFRRYNGKDCCVTVDLIDEHLKWLDSNNMMQFYLDNYYGLYAPMLRAMRHGVMVDEKLRKRRFGRLKADCILIQDKLEIYAGEALHGAKTISPKKLAKFLYETMGLPVQYARMRKEDGSRSITTNEVTVRRLMLRYPKKLGSFETNKDGEFVRPDMPGPLILAHRRKDTLSKFYAEQRFSADGRIRCTYKFGPPTLRLASSKTWKREGSNLQNPDREMRDAFIPDPGCILLECDLSQAEDRVVKAYAAAITKDAKRKEMLLMRARANPWENDEHTRGASLIFYHNAAAATSPLFANDERVTKPQRYLAKKSRHACWTPETELLTEGGWVRSDEYDGESPILQVDPESRIATFTSPLAWHVYDYTGETIAFETKGYSLEVTPEHRVRYLRKAQSETYIITREAGEIADFSDLRLELAGMWSGHRRLSLDLVRLVVAIQADGRMPADEKKVTIRLKRRRKIARLIALLHSCGIEWQTRLHPDGVTSFRFYPPEEVFDVIDRERFWHAGVLQLSGDCLDALLKELVYWDGHKARTSLIYYTKHEANARWVQTIAHLRGLRSLARKVPKGWRAYLSTHKTATVSPSRRHFDGKVYCPTVPTGCVLVRRNGLICTSLQSNYDMKGNRMSEECLKDGLVISPEEGQQYIDTILDRDVPEVRMWQSAIRQEILRNRCLTNSWGLVFDYEYDRLSDELYREGYASKPQSDVGMLLNRWGFVPCDRFLITLSKQQPALPAPRINLQMHDALVISTPPEHAWAIYAFLCQSLERPRRYGGNEVIIPLEAKLGKNWRGDFEFKRPPTKAEFDEKAHEVFSRIQS